MRRPPGTATPRAMRSPPEGAPAAGTTDTELARFVRPLFAGYGAGLIEVAHGRRNADGRLVLGSRRRPGDYIPVEAPERAAARACRAVAAGEEVFVGVLPRRAPRPNRDEVREARCVWLDLDSPDALARAKAHRLPPHLVVASGSGGGHCYWLLRDPVAPEAVEEANRAPCRAPGRRPRLVRSSAPAACAGEPEPQGGAAGPASGGAACARPLWAGRASGRRAGAPGHAGGAPSAGAPRAGDGSAARHPAAGLVYAPHRQRAGRIGVRALSATRRPRGEPQALRRARARLVLLRRLGRPARYADLARGVRQVGGERGDRVGITMASLRDVQRVAWPGSSASPGRQGRPFGARCARPWRAALDCPAARR